MNYQVGDKVWYQGEVLSIHDNDIEVSFAPGYLIPKNCETEHKKGPQAYKVRDRVVCHGGTKGEILYIDKIRAIILYDEPLWGDAVGIITNFGDIELEADFQPRENDPVEFEDEEDEED